MIISNLKLEFTLFYHSYAWIHRQMIFDKCNCSTNGMNIYVIMKILWKFMESHWANNVCAFILGWLFECSYFHFCNWHSVETQVDSRLNTRLPLSLFHLLIRLRNVNSFIIEQTNDDAVVMMINDTFSCTSTSISLPNEATVHLSSAYDCTLRRVLNSSLPFVQYGDMFVCDSESWECVGAWCVHVYITRSLIFHGRCEGL